MRYETVPSYCFSKWWLELKKQDWWPTSRGPLKQAFGVHPTEASKTGHTHRKYEHLKMYVQGVNCVAVGEIGLDHVRKRKNKGHGQQAEVFLIVCRLAREVDKHVLIHCRGTASTAECLWIMKGNLPKDQMVYWHHFNETEEMARDRAGSCIPQMLWLAFLRRSSRSNHPLAAWDVLKRVATIKGVPLPIMRKICEGSSRRLFGHAT